MGILSLGGLALKGRRFIFPVLMVFTIAVLGYGGYLIADRNGYNRAIQETNEQKLETINGNLRIKEKSDNIIRPTDIILINRLREGTF